MDQWPTTFCPPSIVDTLILFAQPKRGKKRCMIREFRIGFRSKLACQTKHFWNEQTLLLSPSKKMRICLQMKVLLKHFPSKLTNIVTFWGSTGSEERHSWFLFQMLIRDILLLRHINFMCYYETSGVWPVSIWEIPLLRYNVRSLSYLDMGNSTSAVKIPENSSMKPKCKPCCACPETRCLRLSYSIGRALC